MWLGENPVVEVEDKIENNLFPGKEKAKRLSARAFPAFIIILEGGSRYVPLVQVEVKSKGHQKARCAGITRLDRWPRLK